jgi:formate hydrogenlyase transcriptional activator
VEGPPEPERAVEAAERYRTLLEINNAIISDLTREPLFRAIAEALGRVVPVERTAIFLHDPERDVLRLFVLHSALPSTYFVVGLEMSPEDSHVGRVFRERRPLLRRDLEREREYPMEDRAFADGVRSYVIVPLVARGTAVGTLAVASTRTGQYSEADAAFLQEVANQVALAVENMQAYERIARLQARLERENVYLQDEIRREHNFDEIVGSSPALLEVLRKVEQAAPTDAGVLILGETGTGKELIARAIHDRSPRRNRPLVKVNCGAIAAGLVESELFGHAKGAFTGALERRVGRFELADGGTLFLDEVGELAPETQVKLLRVLQEREFEPVGSSQTVRVDVRIIAATARDLEEGVRAGRFRADLFYRLNVLPLRAPPLRERRSDVPQLVMFFLDRYGKKLGKRFESVTQETMDLLVSYAWPGNIRELQNVVERSVVLCQGPVLALDRDLLPLAADAALGAAGRAAGAPVLDPRPAAETGQPLAGAGVEEAMALEEVERRHILAVLRQTGGVIEGPRGAARLLNLHPNTLRSRMKKLGISRPSHDMS